MGCALLACAFFLAASGSRHARAQEDLPAKDDELLARVHGAWHERTQRFKRVRIMYLQSNILQTKHIKLPTPDPEAQARLAARSAAPLESEVSISFDGTKARVESRQLNDERHTINVFDGMLQKSINHAAHRDFPQGVLVEKPLPNKNVVDYVPVLMAFRLTAPGLHPLPDSGYSVADRYSVIDGIHAVQLDFGRQEPKALRYLLWLDPARDFVILRSQKFAGTKLQNDLRIHYRELVGEHVPESWTYEAFSASGEVTVSIGAQVQECERNPDLPPGEFELEFPVGTRYVDMRSQQTFIVQESNPSRRFTPQEIQRGATQQDLLTTKAGQAALPPDTVRDRERSTYRLIVVNIAVLGIVLVLWAWRRRRRRE